MTERPLWLLSLVRIRLFLREPSAVFWSFGFPVLMSLALGVAFRNKPPEPARVAIQVGPRAEALTRMLATSPDVKASMMSPTEAAGALRSGRISLVVEAGPTPTYRFDPTRPESRLARLLVDDALQRAEGRRDVMTPADAPVTEPGSRYIDFLIPGLIGMNLMASGMWGIGYSIAETRTKKLLKRMVATPMSRAEFLLSFVIMRMLFLGLELPVVLVFAHYAFQVQIQGSLFLLVFLAALGAFAFSGIGVLVASRSRNTQSVGGLINLVQLPMFVFSGIFFSSANFPQIIQPFIRVLPLTAVNDSMRAVMNEGATWSAVTPHILILVVASVLSFGVALKIFRWE